MRRAKDQRPGAAAAPALTSIVAGDDTKFEKFRACNEVLSHIPNRSSPVGARTGAPRNEGYLPSAGERGDERHCLGRSHLCDSSGFRSLASIARCLLPGLGSPSSVSLHGRSSFGSPLVRQTSPARRVRAEAQPRRTAFCRVASLRIFDESQRQFERLVQRARKLAVGYHPVAMRLQWSVASSPNLVTS
jgi:hypothetical protein